MWLRFVCWTFACSRQLNTGNSNCLNLSLNLAWCSCWGQFWLWMKFKAYSNSVIATVVKRTVSHVNTLIPVGCIPPACQPYMFWWLPLGISTGGWVCPQMNKLEQVSSDDHQMSVVRECGIIYVREGDTLPWDLSHYACDFPTPYGQNDRQMSVKTLPCPIFACRQYISMKSILRWSRHSHTMWTLIQRAM